MAEDRQASMEILLRVAYLSPDRAVVMHRPNTLFETAADHAGKNYRKRLA